jgi:hypothetical protein
MSGYCANDERQATMFGSLAVLGSFVASGGRTVRRRGGGEDPWPCGPGFRRVLLSGFRVERFYKLRELRADKGQKVGLETWVQAGFKEYFARMFEIPCDS